MKHSWLVVLAMMVGCGCSGSATPPAEVVLPDMPPPAAEVPPAAAPPIEERLLLRFVNGATAETLRSFGPSLESVVGHRAGADGALASADDEPLFAASELDELGVTEADRTAVVAAARAAAPVDEACLASTPRTLAVELLVTPDENDAALLARIGAAKKSIDLVMYQLRLQTFRDALVGAAKRGVAVRVILDRTQSTVGSTIAELVAGGVQAKPSPERFNYTHQKSMIVDGRSLFVFTGNFDRASFTSGRNFGVYLREPEDIWDARDLFDADWEDREPVLSCTRLVVAPVNARDRIVELVDSATQEVAVEALYASESRVLAALVRAKSRGANVRVLFNDPSFDVGDATDEASYLTANGISVRRSPDLFIHAKVIAVDGRAVFLGSENFSRNSLLENREVGVVLSADVVDLPALLAVFETDFAAGQPFSF